MKAKEYFKLLQTGDCDVSEVCRDLSYNYPKKAKKVIKMLENQGNLNMRVFMNLINAKP
jgi:hypothetical protein